MATTLEAFAGAHRHNYCTLPTIDVEILPDIRHCECGEPVSFEYETHCVGGRMRVARTTLIPDADNAELKSLLQTGLELFQQHQAHAEHLAHDFP